MNEMILDPIGKHFAFALDGMTLERAISMSASIAGQVAILKANDLVADVGSKTVVEKLSLYVPQGGIWVDLKTNDTDGTMGNTMEKIGKNKARIATVHLFNSQAALGRALKDASNNNCILSGITMLSSFTKKEAEELYNRPFDSIVPMLLERARMLGFRSFVCSAPQLQELIKSGDIGDMVPIIPGTRSMTTADKSELNFQAQTDSTENIIKILAENKIQGIVVIGSEVTKAKDPVQKLAEIKASVQKILDANGLKLIPKIPLLEV